MSVPTRVRPAAPTRRLITDPMDVAWAADRLAAGAVVGHGFANLYALTARPDLATVRAVNAIKGRPPAQVGSITVPPEAILDTWELTRLPGGLDRRRVAELVDVFFGLGPFGFRGPAGPGVPAHLTTTDGGVPTAQVIAPGYACPANDFLRRALRACGQPLLYITSANRSRHATGAEESAAHWRAEELRAEFAGEPGFVLLQHADEAAVRARYPRHLPMSTTILDLHRVVRVPGDPRPHLVLHRHGSLAAEDVRGILADLGYGLWLGPGAASRLPMRA